MRSLLRNLTQITSFPFREMKRVFGEQLKLEVKLTANELYSSVVKYTKSNDESTHIQPVERPIPE
jgi:hypothetical protein